MDFFDWLIFYVFAGFESDFLEVCEKCVIHELIWRFPLALFFVVIAFTHVHFGALQGFWRLAAGLCGQRGFFAEVWGGRRPQRHKNTRSECPVPFRWRKGGHSLHWTRAHAIPDQNTPIFANSGDPIAVNRWPLNLKPIVAPVTYAGALKRHNSL